MIGARNKNIQFFVHCPISSECSDEMSKLCLFFSLVFVVVVLYKFYNDNLSDEENLVLSVHKNKTTRDVTFLSFRLTK